MLKWLVGKIMDRAVLKNIANDKDFQAKMAGYNRKIKQCEDGIESAIKDIESRHGPVKRIGTKWTCLKCGKENIPPEIDVCPQCGTDFHKYARQLLKERIQRKKEESKKLSPEEKAR